MVVNKDKEEQQNDGTTNNNSQVDDNASNTTGSVEEGTNTTYDENGAFLCTVEDTFTITGRGTVVTGIIQRGKVKIGDTVQIIGLDKEIISTKVKSIEVLKLQKEEATTGEYVTFLLEGITKDQIQRGQILAQPNSIIAANKFDADIYALSVEEGGRRTPFFDDYGPYFYFRTTDIRGFIDLPDNIEMVNPGDRASVTITLDSNVAMEVGTEFSIREGGRTIGTGIVTKIH